MDQINPIINIDNYLERGHSYQFLQKAMAKVGNFEDILKQVIGTLKGMGHQSANDIKYKASSIIALPLPDSLDEIIKANSLIHQLMGSRIYALKR